MIRRLSCKFSTARINCFVCWNHTEVFAVLANFKFINTPEIAQLGIGKSQSLCATHAVLCHICQGNISKCMTFINDDLHLIKEPWINLCGLMNTINSDTTTQSFSYLKNSFRCRHRSLCQYFFVRELVVQRFTWVTVQTKTTLF